MKKLLLIVSTFIVFSIPSFGQSSAVQAGNNIERITLQQSVDIALKNNIQVKQSEVSAKTSEILLQQAKNNKLPSLNGGINQSINFGRGIDFSTNTYSTQTVGNNNMGLNADVVLYQGGTLQNTIKQNAINLKASQMDMEAIKNNIALQVVVAYLNILSFEDQLSISKTQTEITKLQIDRASKLVAAGSLPQSSVYDLKAQLATEETAIVNNEGGLESAKLTLEQLLNEKNIHNYSYDRVAIPTPNTNGYGSNSDEVYQVAESTQPAIKASDLRIESSQIGIKIAEAAFLPSLSMTGGIGSGYSSLGKDIVTKAKIGYFEQLGNNRSQNVGLNLNIPIFNKYANKTRFEQANLSKINSELGAQATRQSLRQNIEQAFVNMTNAAKRYDQLIIQVSALEESFRAAESRFNAGAIDFVAYSLQKTNLDKARANLIQSKYDYVFRTKILDFYQNKPLGF